MLLALNLVHTQYLNPEHLSAPLPQQVQAGGYFIKLTNDITFCSNNTTALPVFPGLNK